MLNGNNALVALESAMIFTPGPVSIRVASPVHTFSTELTAAK
jgi:hypothetical protein